MSASQTIPDAPCPPLVPAKHKMSEASMPKSQMSMPSSITPPGSESAPVSKPAEGNSQSRREIEPSSDTYENEEEEGEEEEESVLTEFEWAEFEQRYTKNLKQHFAEECEIIDEFEQYAASFTAWAQAACQRDNGRMSKRLKTRKVFTQLAEASLEDKKKHYLGVLHAFQKAMDMLRQQ